MIINEEILSARILIVDDNPANIYLVEKILDAAGYTSVLSTADSREAVELYKSFDPDILLLDINMPYMDGFAIMQKLKEETDDDYHPILVLTAQHDMETRLKALESGARDFLTKPLDQNETLTRIRNMIELRILHKKVKEHNLLLEQKVYERTKELSLTQEATIFSLAVLAEFRDPETGGHIRRTQHYMKILAEYLRSDEKYKNELNPQTIDLLFKSAPLHDIGKVGVPDHILLKPGKLTSEEFEEMKIHTIFGRDAILAAEQKLEGTSSFLKYALEIAYGHQEKWDGKGYPQGIAGEIIPLSARIMAIADVYDALISKRVYKPPFTHEKAVKIILEGKGNHFDPDMVAAFESIHNTFRKIAIEFADFDEEREALSE